MKTALFIDFEDSFSFNVIQRLQESGLNIRRLNWKEFSTLSDEDLLVLGPGPGHPDDYASIFPLVHEWIKQGRGFFGVCLGHQIFWRMKGAKVQRSLHPRHGQKVQLELTPDWQKILSLPRTIFVQRYNSLCVPEADLPESQDIKNYSSEGEVLISRGNKILTYQFHPESEGTTYPQAFFSPVRADLV
jgi:anthranilate/para-aminobenzoate synthase component II